MCKFTTVRYRCGHVDDRAAINMPPVYCKQGTPGVSSRQPRQVCSNGQENDLARDGFLEPIACPACT
jgi:hypothetical protein